MYLYILRSHMTTPPNFRPPPNPITSYQPLSSSFSSKSCTIFRKESKMADDALNIYDEIEIEDMTFDPAMQIYHFPCPCGDRFEIAIDDLRDGEEIAVCPSCSLMIRVIFDLVCLAWKSDVILWMFFACFNLPFFFFALAELAVMLLWHDANLALLDRLICPRRITRRVQARLLCRLER